MLSLCVNPDKARKIRHRSEDRDRDVCTMCGDFCALKTYNRAFDDGNG
jgi:phosphomethylpyrimidine synthase